MSISFVCLLWHGNVLRESKMEKRILPNDTKVVRTVANGSRVLFVCLVMLLPIVTFAHLMMRPIEPNEHMYVAASVLARSQRLYQDFAFLQMPNLPLLFSTIYRVTQTEYYFFVARLISWLALLATAGTIGLMAWSFTRANLEKKEHSDRTPNPMDRTAIWIGMGASWLLVFSESFIVASGESSNYILPMFLSLLAGWVQTSLRRWYSPLLCGLTISLACGLFLQSSQH